MLVDETIEGVLGVLGCGRRTVPLFIMVLLANMMQIHLIMMSLVGIPLPFRCHSSTSSYQNDVAYLVPDSQSTQSAVAVAVPITGMHEVSREDYFVSECLALDSLGLGQPHTSNYSSSPSPSPTPPPPWLHYTGMASCPYIEYDHSLYTTTIVSQFHLVCERAPLRPLFHIMATLGVVIGAGFATPLSDWMGRVTGLRIGVALAVPAYVALPFMPWYQGVLVLRVVVAIFCRSCQLTAISLTMESIPSHNRSTIGMLMGAPYSLLVMLVATVSYFFREWRFLHLFSGVALYFVLPLSFMVEESPRWLAQNGQGHKAAEILRRAADYNKVVLPPHLSASLDKLQMFPQNKASDETNYNQPVSGGNVLKEFRDSPSTLCVLLGSALLWFFIALMYYCVMLNSTLFSSTSAEIYMFLAGMLEALGILIVTPVTQRLGRRLVMGAGAPVCGCLLMANLFVPQDLAWLVWLLAAGTMFISSAVYQVLYLYISEVFPTVIRSLGLGMSCSLGLLGSMVAPLVIDTLVQTVWWGGGAVMVITGAVVAVLVCFLPETNNVILPDTIKDLEDLRNGKKPPRPPPSSHVV